MRSQKNDFSSNTIVDKIRTSRGTNNKSKILYLANNFYECSVLVVKGMRRDYDVEYNGYRKMIPRKIDINIFRVYNLGDQVTPND